MVSSARAAQFGLGAMVLVLGSSLAVLAGRAIEHHKAEALMAPQFMLRDVDGNSHSLSELHGQAVVLFFGSLADRQTSAYCERLIRFAQEHADQAKVMMIDTGRRHDEWALNELRVHRSVTEQSFTTLLDIDSEVAQRYEIKKMPTVVVIDKGGKIRYRGAFDDSVDESQVGKRYCEDMVALLHR